MRTITLIFILASLQLHGQSKIDKQVGNLEFTKTLNSEKTSYNLSDFKSKIVILDFWATWCAPCIASFPHLEELQNKFSTEIKIITITSDSEERIKRFLQKRKISLPIVIDKDRKLANEFPHNSIPHTIIIDKNGIVKAVTSPEQIKEETVRQIISGQQTNLTEKLDELTFDFSKPLSLNENFTHQITVTPFRKGVPGMANPTGGNGVYKDRRILCTNLSPQTLYEVAYQFPPKIKTVIKAKDKGNFEWNDQTAICFDLIVPEEIGQKRFEIMQQHLGYIFNYKAVIEKTQREVRILKRIDGQNATIKQATVGDKLIDSSRGRLLMRNGGMKEVVDFLESELRIPVVDETNFTGLYDLELPWYEENSDQIYEELKKIGLELIKGTRSVDLLVIYDK